MHIVILQAAVVTAICGTAQAGERSIVAAGPSAFPAGLSTPGVVSAASWERADALEPYYFHDGFYAGSLRAEVPLPIYHPNPELTKRMDDLFAQIGQGKMEHLGEKEIIELGDHCVMPLTRFIQSDRSRANKEQRGAAARILAKIAQPWSVPDLIELLADDDEGVRYHAATALERLTEGETQGITPQEWAKAAGARRGGAIQKWQEWWEKNKVQYPGNPSESPPVPKLRKG